MADPNCNKCNGNGTREVFKQTWYSAPLVDKFTESCDCTTPPPEPDDK